MAWFGRTRKGKKICLLNPSEKARKYADELGNGVKQTNDGHLKMDKNGKPIRLTSTERAHRIGYLRARSDNAKAFKSKRK
ncbi:MAG: hypothetical protein K2N64_01100 [Anaeroplasmataceae bacterium]|nr:hypothetical protein [Anaeroplasmataceae bacterium]